MNLMSGLAGLAGFGQSFADASSRADTRELQKQQLQMQLAAQQQEQAMRQRQMEQEQIDRMAFAKRVDPAAFAESYGDMGNRPSAVQQLPSLGVQKELWQMGQKEQPTYSFQTIGNEIYAIDPKNPQDRQRLGDAKADGIVGEFMSVVGRKPQSMSEVLGFIRQKAQAGHIKEPTQYKPESFVNTSGEYIWVSPGQPVPKGFMPVNSKGMSITTNPDGTFSFQMGGATGTKAAEEGARAKEIGASLITEDIGRALTMIDNPKYIPTTGAGALLSDIPGTEAHDLQQILEGIKPRIGFDTLQAMRNASKTGGALGQVSDRELSTLQAVYGSLVQSQTADQLKYNLVRLNRVYNDIVHGPGNWNDTLSSGGAPAGQTTTPKVMKFDAQGNMVK